MSGFSIGSRFAAALCATVWLVACQKAPAPAESATPPAPAALPAPVPQPTEPSEPATFVNKVWRVTSSSAIPADGLYVFVSDGTMLITSPNATPAIGAWNQNDGQLTWVEEGRPYKVDVLSLDAVRFHVRVNGPGDPIDILFELDRP